MTLRDRVLAHLKRERPALRNRVDALAFAVHAACIGRECRLVGLNEDQAEQQLSTLPTNWNSSSDIFCFKYRIERVAEPIIVKVLTMGTSLYIHATTEGSNAVHSLELSIDDYVSPDVDLTSFDNIYHNIDGLLVLLEEMILSKVIPPAPMPRPLGIPAREDRPYHDPLRMPERPQRPYVGGDFGGDMLPPTGPMPGFGGPPGNIMGPDHPIFGGRGRGRGGMGPRFDPFGPNRGFGSDPDRDHLPPPGAHRNDSFPF